MEKRNINEDLHKFMESYLISRKALQYMCDDEYYEFLIERENTIKKCLLNIIKNGVYAIKI